jgi:SAM-dependent methyltransferase
MKERHGADDTGDDFEEERDLLMGIINRYLGFHTLEAQRETRNDTSLEYPFVPMDTRQVIEQVRCVARYLLEHRPSDLAAHTFLDIGCGTGNVLVVAEQGGFEVFGLEKDEHPCRVAQKFFGAERVVQADIWNYPDYHKFDVIYYFCPFANNELQRRFELFIEETMQPGAILVANQKRSDAIVVDQRFRRIHPLYQIWEKLSA